MKLDAIINKMAHDMGKSRKEIIQLLKEMSADETVREQLKKHKRK